MNLKFRFLIIIAAVVICFLSVTPPKERLGLGKDLAGGTTLTYRILPDADGNPPSRSTLDQIISVLMARIDPQGIYDISIVPLGTSQIEITMPAPTPEVKQLAADLDDAIDAIDETAITESDVDAVMPLPPDEREARLAELAAGVEGRLPLLRQAAEAYDAQKAQRAEYEALVEQQTEALAEVRSAVRDAEEVVDEARAAAEECGVPIAELDATRTITDETERQDAIKNILFDNGNCADQINAYLDAVEALDDEIEAREAAEDEWLERRTPIEKAAAEAITAYHEARDAVLATSLTGDEVRQAFGRSQEKKFSMDRATGEVISFPSPREEAIDRLYENYPLLREKIEAALTAYDAYKEKASGYDDPKDLISLLRGAGVLSFQIAVSPIDPLPIDILRRELREGGPNSAMSSNQVRWYQVDKLEQWYNEPRELEALKNDPYTYFANRYEVVAEEFDGEIYMLLYTTSDRNLDESAGEWEVTRAYPSQDRTGRPAVGFELDARGATLFRKLTGGNVDRQMAIVLDERVFTAPGINEAIGKQGIIQGEFTQQEIEYLLRVLNAGALAAKLKGPVAQNTIGPSLGADNLKRGLEAGILALIIVGLFMMAYYFMSGVVANVALICNAIFILGIMAMQKAAFTMPGIAGIVLTFGMAVDANVLIYERIREELETGVDLRTAIRFGYEKVFSTIIDANITNLIVCFVLAFTATAEVKGFALTLGIGIVSTLFCALFITRAIFDLYADVFNAESLPMLPSVWGLLNKILHPNVPWVRHRMVFVVISGVAMISAIVLTRAYWNEMLDVVFKGGTSVTITFDEDEVTGEPMMVPRAEVESRFEDKVRQLFEGGSLTEEVYDALKNVSVVNYNVDQTEGLDFRGNQFVIRTTLEDMMKVEQVALQAFEGMLQIDEPIMFEGADFVEQVPSDLVRPILEPQLGRNIDDPTISRDVRKYIGGVAILLQDIHPVSTIDEIHDRLDRMRGTEEYRRYGGRDFEVVGLRPDPAGGVNDEGEPLWQSVAVLVASPEVSILEQRNVWDVQVAEKEWEITRRALTDPQSFDQITQIGSAVAAQFRAKATVAIILSLAGILVYIWFRFGSFRYSAAAIVALVHDCVITLGLLSFTHLVYNTWFGQMALIEPFQIDLGVIAALLTIIGYSLNDTIVILDRVRENRGKLAVTSEDVVNRSINQTFSRTLLTSGTTLLAVLIMYIEGGTGIRPFTYAMLCGVLVGTYSSVAVAAPMVFSKSRAAARSRPSGAEGGSSGDSAITTPATPADADPKG